MCPLWRSLGLGLGGRGQPRKAERSERLWRSRALPPLPPFTRIDKEWRSRQGQGQVLDQPWSVRCWSCARNTRGTERGWGKVLEIHCFWCQELSPEDLPCLNQQFKRLHVLTPSHTFSHLLTPSHGHDSYLIANYLIAIWQLFDSYLIAVIAVMCRKGVVSVEVAPRTLLLEEALVLVQVLASRLRHWNAEQVGCL